MSVNLTPIQLQNINHAQDKFKRAQLIPIEHSKEAIKLLKDASLSIIDCNVLERDPHQYLFLSKVHFEMARFYPKNSLERKTIKKLLQLNLGEASRSIQEPECRIRIIHEIIDMIFLLKEDQDNVISGQVKTVDSLP